MTAGGAATTLTVELMVDDIAAARDFYARVLGFSITGQEANGYTTLRLGTVAMAVKPRKTPLGPDVPPRERPGRGVEIILEVDDVEAAHTHVTATGWPLANPLTTHPWGQTDFRVADPDGYHLRITSRA